MLSIGEWLVDSLSVQSRSPVTADKLADTFVKNRIKFAETALVVMAKGTKLRRVASRTTEPGYLATEWTV